MPIGRIAAMNLALFTGIGFVAWSQPPEIPPSRLPGETQPASDVDPEPDKSGPRYMLSLLGVESSDFNRLTDGNTIAFGENETLIKMLYAAGRLEPVRVHDWTEQNRKVPLDVVVQRPDEHRGQFFPVRGVVTEVATKRPLPALATQFEVKRFYRCEVKTESGEPAVVYARDVPDEWPMDKAIAEPVSFRGMFLKLAAGALDDEEPGKPVFVATRVAWHPPNLLGKLNVDVGRFGDVRHYTKLNQHDTECFYQTLAAMKRLGRGKMAAAAEEAVGNLKPLRGTKPMEEFHVAQLFSSADKVVGLRRRIERLESLPALAKRIGEHVDKINQTEDPAQKKTLEAELEPMRSDLAAILKALKVPADTGFDQPTPRARLRLKQWVDEQLAKTREELDELRRSPVGQGQPMVFEGTLKQAVRARVEDQDLQKQFGIDHYYHAIVFVELGGRFKLRKESEQEFTQFAVHLCLPDWPDGMPLGENLNEHVRISGVFFKIWAYQSESSQAENSRTGHPAPLLIGTEPIWYRDTSETNTLYAMIGGGLFLIVLLSIVFWLMRAGRGDRKLRKAVNEKLDPGGDISLDDLKLD